MNMPKDTQGWYALAQQIDNTANKFKSRWIQSLYHWTADKCRTMGKWYA
jgi:hypothetical protein